MEHSTEYPAMRRARPADRTRARGASDQGASVGRYALMALAAFSALLVLAVAVDALSSAGRVHPGVTVGGVQVGGKTPADAATTLKAKLPAKAAVPVRVVLGSTTWSVNADEVGASFDYAKLIDNAMTVGRSGGFVGSAGQRIRAWFVGAALPAPATADPHKLNATIGRIASAVDIAPKDAALSVSSDGVTFKPSATGIALDRRQLASDILGAFTADTSRTITVRAVTARPRITDAAARQTQGVVERMISDPVSVTYKTKSWTVSTAELAKMIELQSVESGGPSGGAWHLVPIIGTQEASKTIVPKVGAALGSLPEDARFVAQGGAVTIVPSKDGIGPDVGAFAANLLTVLRNPHRSRTVELRTRVMPPKLSTDQARAMGIRGQISTFTTTYSTQLAPRVNNIHVLGAALDGKLVAPGGTFSLNGAVGQRTAAKGYQEANAIVKGKLVPQMGGGICQVATTLFNAVFMSGLPVVERVNHSFYISHYPMGRDATVSWGGPDLRWRNTTSHWILVSVGYTGNSITVSLYGTPLGYDVSYATVPFTNSVPFKTTKITNPTLPRGTQQVLATGENGGKVVVTRTVKSSGSVVRADTFTSDYVPVDETIDVGTKAAGSKAAITKPTPTKP